MWAFQKKYKFKFQSMDNKLLQDFAQLKSCNNKFMILNIEATLFQNLPKPLYGSVQCSLLPYNYVGIDLGLMFGDWLVLLINEN